MFLLLSCISTTQKLSSQISVHPSGHYFVYHGEPVILITSDHTYAAVITPNFDYVTFLNTLAAAGMNFTRIYPGAYPGTGWTGEPLILPWAKSVEELYDLDIWDPDYFYRLHGFMNHALSRGIIVDIVLFNGFGTDKEKTYQERWELCALNDTNNVQKGVGTKRDYFCTLQEESLVNYQKAYVHKLVTELNRYDNLIYDIADEPDFFNMIPESLVNPWICVMLEEVLDTEANLPVKHLIGQTHHPSLEDGEGTEYKDWCTDPRTSWISVEYTFGLKDFSTEYAMNKPYVLIETVSPVANPIGFWKSGYGVDAARVHAWAFLVAGGIGFMEYNDDYDPAKPSGGPVTDEILRQKKVLLDFLYGFDFTRMSYYTGFSGINHQPIRDTTIAWASAMAETGKQYVMYINYSYIDCSVAPGFYHVMPGQYQETVTLNNVPSGNYSIEWVNPSDGNLLERPVLKTHPGGSITLKTPLFSVDIALRMLRTQ
jgi:hypothetical protein